MSSTVRLVLVFHVFIAVAVMVMVCGRRSLWPSWYRPGTDDDAYRCRNETCPRAHRPCYLTTPSACRLSFEMDSRVGSLSTHMSMHRATQW